MHVQEIMTRDPVCCGRNTDVTEIARIMAKHDCGVVPVLGEDERPVGIVTDRDITIRCVAREEDPRAQHAFDVMTDEVVTIRPDRPAEEAADLMRDRGVRRLLVTDERDNLVGIVSQADLARHAPVEDVGETVREISEPTEAAAATTRA